MRKFVIPFLVATSIALSGCATGKSIFEGGSSLTSSINTPVGQVDLYRVKNVYAAALAVSVSLREFCYGVPGAPAKSYAVLMADPASKAVCQNRRAVVRTLQVADKKAFAAITTADNFIRNNPTISAVSAVGAAWAAVTDFQNLTAAVPIVVSK